MKDMSLFGLIYAPVAATGEVEPLSPNRPVEGLHQEPLANVIVLLPPRLSQHKVAWSTEKREKYGMQGKWDGHV